MQISALFRMLFSYKTVIATICLASTIMANAAEPQIVKDAVEAAEWMAKTLSSSGYKADFTLDSLKEIDRFVDDQARGEIQNRAASFQTIWVRVFSRLAHTLVKSFAGKVKASGAATITILREKSIWPFS
jgi:hypothetical protein